MQPCSREMQGMNSILNQTQMSLQDLHQNPQNPQIANHQIQSFDPTSPHDDFLEQMLSNLPSSSWPDLAGMNTKSPWDISSNTMAAAGIGSNKSIDMAASDDHGTSNPESVLQHQFCFDDDHSSAVLASKLRQQQISGGGGGGGASLSAAKSLLLHQQLMMQARGGGLRSPTVGSGAGESGLLSMPLRLGSGDEVVDVSSFKSSDPGVDVQALYNGFAGSLHGNGQTSNHAHHFQNPQNYGAPATVMNQVTAASGSGGGGGGAAAQPRPRVRARRGQATDPHSIAERLRRERIAERMKALQELVPNANKTDKASMLDEIIDYVKFLQLQVKVLSMSRLGGAAAVAPLVADMSSEGAGDSIHSSGGGRGSNGTQTAASTSNNNNNNNDNMTVTEHQVAKLMEEDMGSAMQYLQGKGLCLMPISLATAISTATCRSRNPVTSTHSHPLFASNGGAVAATAEGGGGPSSPSLSVLTVQSATMGNGGGDASSVKDAVSVSKP